MGLEHGKLRLSVLTSLGTSKIKNICAGIGLGVRIPVRIPPSYIRVPKFESGSTLSYSLLRMYTERQQVLIVQVLCSLLPTWEPLVEFLVLSFGLAQLNTVQAFGSEPVSGSFLCFLFLVTHSNLLFATTTPLKKLMLKCQHHFSGATVDWLG